MTGYECPNCHGGFPADALDDNACPWCGQRLGDAEPYEPFAARSITKKNSDETGQGVIARLFT